MSNPNYNLWCNIGAESCVSGCCDLWGDCATRLINCDFRYDDYLTNSAYYFPDDTAPAADTATAATVNSIGGIIGGIIAAVVVVAIIIGVAIWWKRRHVFDKMAVHEQSAGSTTVIMGNPTPQYPTQPYQGQPYQGQPYNQGAYIAQPNQFTQGQYPAQQGPLIISTWFLVDLYLFECWTKNKTVAYDISFLIVAHKKLKLANKIIQYVNKIQEKGRTQVD